MHIILLSGGSGKRLWPLSNEVRSKQFIKLFIDNDGNHESMVQRVFRQIKRAIPDAQITIATSGMQKSVTMSQLGSRVNICLEPCRRDTFPAIALAASYLKDVLGVSSEEPVVVCPVDPYVREAFFDAIGRMAELISQKTANLTLMGITPTYPSEKYGYIIPESPANLSPVRSFKEKPNKEKAREYLHMGALWNAGVFGFQLSYLLNKSHEMIDFTDYKDLLAKYEDLPKISFDYAVVEKEPSIQVMSYSGEWRDVGTWNMMAEVMEKDIIGNADMDDACWNTQIINELEIPVLVMGVSNAIVAASGDGILVSDKYRSGYMKPYVDRLAIQARFAEKSWGTYQVVDKQPGTLTVKLCIWAGKQLAYHYHKLRSEVWTVLSGSGRAVIDGETRELKPGDTLNLPPMKPHRLIADTDLQIIEIQFGTETTYEDKYAAT